MTDINTLLADVEKLFSDDEDVTAAKLAKVNLPSGKVLGLVTLDNGHDHTRPNTFGPKSLVELNTAYDAALADPEIDAIAVFSAISERGPNVFGRVWSWPLSRVIRPITPAGCPSRAASVTLRRCARVTTSASEEISCARVSRALMSLVGLAPSLVGLAPSLVGLVETMAQATSPV